MIQIRILLLSFFIQGTAWIHFGYANAIFESNCSHPYWAEPAESQNGLFHGNLIMDCKISASTVEANLNSLKNGIIQKIKTDSTIHDEPSVEKLESSPALKWDVSHRIAEEGSDVTIREEAVIETDQKTQLIYQTHSKKVTASGMAGFLKSVNFFMKVKKIQNNAIEIEFRNEVTVERPWYALDFIFTPIAQNICFEKMEKVKKNLLPWIVRLL